MVPADWGFLDEHGLRPWVDIPHYIPDDDPEPGFYRVRGDLRLIEELLRG